MSDNQYATQRRETESTLALEYRVDLRQEEYELAQDEEERATAKRALDEAQAALDRARSPWTDGRAQA